jgi:type II secretion system protein C
VDLALLPSMLVPDTRLFAKRAGIIAASALALSLVSSLLIRHFAALPEGTTVHEPTIVASEKPAGTTPTPAESAPPRLASFQHRKLAKNAYLDPILKRNIFDSSAIGATAEAGQVTGEGRKTDLKVSLLATVVAEPQEYSSALIASGESSDASVQGYGIGDDLLGEAQILQIQVRKVIIRRTDGTVEYIPLGDEVIKTETSPVTPAADTEGVNKTSENSFTIDASLVQDALSNIENVASQLHAVPHRGPDGQVDGYRLSAIRRGSLLQKLGIKNGDIVHAVNGFPLTDTTSAMSAYQSMQNERHFSFDITRRNQKQTFDYDVR